MYPLDSGYSHVIARLTDQVQQLRRLAEAQTTPCPQLISAIADIEETLAQLQQQADASYQADIIAELSPAYMHDTALYHAMADHAPVGLLVVDDHTNRILYGNQRFCEIWQLEQFADTIHSGRLKNDELTPHVLPLLNDMNGFLANSPDGEDNHATFEDELSLTDGRTLRRVSSRIDTHNAYLGRYVIYEDITERKSAEQALQEMNAQLEARIHERTAALERVNDRLWAEVIERQRAEAALQREQAFLYAAIEVLPFPVVFMSDDHTIVLANSAARQVIPEPMSDTILSLQLLSSETHAPIPREEWPMVRALRGEVVSMCELLARLPGECAVPLLIHASPVTFRGEHPAAVVAWQDISALKQADHAKDEFLAVLSHELLTPLTSILGWASVAHDAMLNPTQLPHALEVIERNGRRQKRLVDDLLDLSRIVHGKMLLSMELLELGELVEQVVENISQTVANHGVILHVESADTPLPLQADPLRIGQVITNLLNNALKFTPVGGNITLSLTREAGTAVLAVHDSGRGIPFDELSGIFNPFKQVQRDEAKGGLGLGLAVVRGIVELHGGQVRAESEGRGKGSTFIVTLPLTAAPGSADAPAQGETI